MRSDTPCRCRSDPHLHRDQAIKIELARKLGLALGDPDAALADLTIAVEVNTRMGALPWLTQAHDAATLARHRG